MGLCNIAIFCGTRFACLFYCLMEIFRGRCEATLASAQVDDAPRAPSRPYTCTMQYQLASRHGLCSYSAPPTQPLTPSVERRNCGCLIQSDVRRVTTTPTGAALTNNASGVDRRGGACDLHVRRPQLRRACWGADDVSGSRMLMEEVGHAWLHLVVALIEKEEEEEEEDLSSVTSPLSAAAAASGPR
jgi:hypothetical protein